ncbi:hypothetical protein ACIRH0_03790 [Streptomyces sp. NPDC093675]|uniref:hypothetical protein n=1 Tax=Streptomyces sp. NPDC093675 TaxID=3366049 RepID=UPI0038255D67
MNGFWRDSQEQPHCGHWIGPEGCFCLSGEDLHPYLTGLRCPLHTPSALRAAQEAQAADRPLRE